MAKKASAAYLEKLKDPRWQKKRLEILNRDEWTCRSCESITKTLHVHHCEYEWGREPWDYPDEQLVTLCFECHEAETALSAETKKKIWHVFAMHGVLASPVDDLACGVYHRIRFGGMDPTRVAKVLAAIVNYDELWDAAAESYDKWWAELDAFGQAVSDEFDATYRESDDEEPRKGNA